MLFKRTSKILVSSAKPSYMPLLKNALLPSSSANLCFSAIRPACPKFSFSTNKEPEHDKSNQNQGPDQVNKPQQQQQQANQEKYMILTERFEDYMKDKIKNWDVNYTYNSKVIYQLFNDETMLTDPRNYAIKAAIWAGISSLVYNFLPSWTAIVPAYVFLSSSFHMITSLAVKSSAIYKIELVDNTLVKIYPVKMKGNYILCNIKENGIVSVMRTPQKGVEMPPFSIMTKLIDAETRKEYSTLTVCIDLHFSRVPNIDLLKCVLKGDVNEVAKFKYAGVN